MSNNIYGALALKDSSGALDLIDGTNLLVGDIAVVVTDEGSYFYSLISSTETENVPAIIQPALNGLTKRWKLTSISESQGDFTVLGTLTSDKISFTGSELTIAANTNPNTPIATFSQSNNSVSFSKITQVDSTDIVTGLNAQFVNGQDGFLMMLSDGSVPFTAPVTGSLPVSGSHLATKAYVDNLITAGAVTNLTINNILTANTITSAAGQDLVLKRGGTTVATFGTSGVTFNRINSVTDTTMVNNLNAQYLGGILNTAFSLANGTRAFTGTVSGVTPTLDAHLATKAYVDGGGTTNLSNTARMIGGVAYKNILGIVCPPSLEVTASDYINDSNGAPDAFTYTRNSIATAYDQTGLLTTYAANELRHDHDPITGAYKGWLIEPAATNLFTYSQDFTNSIWTKGQLTASNPGNAAAMAPDGTLTASLLTEDTTTNTHAVSYNTSIASGTNTTSVYAKAGTGSFIYLSHWNATNGPALQWFNLTTGTKGTMAGARTQSSTMTAVGNGWYRCTLTSLSTIVDTMQIFMASADSTQSYLGTSKTVYIWGAQCEVNGYSTSYIPTTSAQGTRAADALSIPTANFPYNASEGTLYVEGSVPAFPGNAYLTQFDDGTGNNSLISYFNNGNLWGDAYNGGVTQAHIQSGTSNYTVNTFYRMGLAYSLNSTNIAVNGVAATVDTTCTIPTVTILRIGSIPSGTPTSSWIKQVAYFPRRLSDAELILLTK